MPERLMAFLLAILVPPDLPARLRGYESSAVASDMPLRADGRGKAILSVAEELRRQQCEYLPAPPA
jgi:hypothetical protein